jgi:hypothetical protein
MLNRRCQYRYKAVVYDKPGTISTKIEELETPEPGPGDVLVRLTHSGVCHSDMGVMENSWRGRKFEPIPRGIDPDRFSAISNAKRPSWRPRRRWNCAQAGTWLREWSSEGRRSRWHQGENSAERIRRQRTLRTR